jgi:peptidoglycan biosynthesis protein MviN/MurJ (putative lipid II flippase)
LVLSGGALVCFAGFIAVTIASDARTLAGALVVAAFVCALLALGYLRRAWSDPDVRNDPQVVRARRLSEVAITAWGIAIIPNFIVAFWPELAESFRWLSAVSVILVCIAVAAFIAMLAITARWTPRVH